MNFQFRSNSKWLPLLICLILGCKGPTYQKQQTEEETKNNLPKKVIIRSFEEDQRLFLNFYKGMSEKELIQTIINEFKAIPLYSSPGSYGKSLLSGKDYIYEKGYELTEEEIKNLEILYGMAGGFKPYLYYKFSTADTEYFGQIKPVFDDSDWNLEVKDFELQNFILEFNIHFSGQIKPSKEESIIMTNKMYRQISNLYQSKYGNPKEEKKDSNLSDLLIENTLKKLNLKKDEQDMFRTRMSTEFLYLDKERNLIVIIRCPGTELMSVKYGLYSDYLSAKNKEIKKNQIKEVKRNQSQSKTKSEI